MRAFVIASLSLGVVASRAAAQHDGDYTEPRNAVVDAKGARVIRIVARAGELRVEGKPGATQVQVRGTARASSERLLADIKLIAERRGDTVVIEADIPHRGGWRALNDAYRGLDLVIDVPQGAALEVEDSSGDLEIRKVGALDLDDSSGSIELHDIEGAVRVDDSSGEVRIEGVKGDVRLRDSSGGIEVRHVTGSVTVENDSSGEIEMADVSGTIHVERDSSGGIHVADVGGDFIVDRDGSGDIDMRNVKGTVRIPGRRR
jgi:putative adhesin